MYRFQLDIDWQLVGKISVIDRFDAEWSGITRREGKSLRYLKNVATIQSVGSSTRIEGSQLADEQISTLIQSLDFAKLEERDEQEVAGYYQTLDLISNSFDTFTISESIIKSLHNEMLRYVEKDKWHRGNYKQSSNAVQATYGEKTEIIFQTTEPGIATEEEMRHLVRWYLNEDQNVHPLVKVAVFVYEFLSIHPFQDGNGRLSRLLTTLLLLQNGYHWIEYVSFENEIERKKGEYYLTLRKCQSDRPGEDVKDWVIFFLTCLESLTLKLREKVGRTQAVENLTIRQKRVYRFIESQPGSKMGSISKGVKIPISSTRAIVDELMDLNMVRREGELKGSRYFVI